MQPRLAKSFRPGYGRENGGRHRCGRRRLPQSFRSQPTVFPQRTLAGLPPQPASVAELGLARTGDVEAPALQLDEPVASRTLLGQSALQETPGDVVRPARVQDVFLDFAAAATAGPGGASWFFAVVRVEGSAFVVAAGAEEAAARDLGAVHPLRGGKLSRFQRKQLGELQVHVALKQRGRQLLLAASWRKERLVLSGGPHQAQQTSDVVKVSARNSDRVRVQYDLLTRHAFMSLEAVTSNDDDQSEVEGGLYKVRQYLQ